LGVTGAASPPSVVIAMSAHPTKTSFFSYVSLCGTTSEFRVDGVKGSRAAIAATPRDF
jgi:hypothetical protein